MVQVFRCIPTFFLLAMNALLISTKKDITLIDPSIDTTIFRLERYGLGSNLVNMLAFKNYFESIGHAFMVDESRYYYTYKNEGIFKAFFDPAFRVFDHTDEISNFTKTNFNNAQQLTQLSNRGGFYNMIRRKIGFRGMSFYDRVSKEACTSLKFSKIGRRRTNMFKIEHKLPNFSKISVGFHGKFLASK